MINLKRFGSALLAVTCAALLQSCAGDYEKAVHPHPDDCPNADPEGIPININYERDPIMVTGPNQPVYEGDKLRFNLVGADNKRVSTFGKNAEAGWLNGSGKKKPGKANSDRFYICVPTDLFEGEPADVTKKEYEYNVDAEGRSQLDPVVPVRRLN